MREPMEGIDSYSQRLSRELITALRSPLLKLQLLCESEMTVSEAGAEARSLVRLLDSIALLDTFNTDQQLQLPLVPVSLRPLYDDVLQQLTPTLRAYGVGVENRLPRHPVLAHRESTMFAAEHLIRSILFLPVEDGSAQRRLLLHARTYQGRSDIGLYDTSANLRSKQVSQLRHPQRVSAHQSALHLHLAEALLAGQGSRLRSSIYSTYGGVAYSLHKSDQLTLVV